MEYTVLSPGPCPPSISKGHREFQSAPTLLPSKRSLALRICLPNYREAMPGHAISCQSIYFTGIRRETDIIVVHIFVPQCFHSDGPTCEFPTAGLDTVPRSSLVVYGRRCCCCAMVMPFSHKLIAPNGDREVHNTPSHWG